MSIFCFCKKSSSIAILGGVAMPLLLRVASLNKVGSTSSLKGSDSHSPRSTPPSHRRSVVLFVDIQFFVPFGTGRRSCLLHPVPGG